MFIIPLKKTPKKTINMKFIFTSLFFGSLLILWGLSLIIEAIFGVSIPFIKIGFAALLIYAGAILIKGLYPAPTQKTIFMAREKSSSEFQEYKIVMGEGIIDLSSLSTHEDQPKRITIHVILGSCTIKLNPDVKTIIHANSVLSGVSLPDKTVVAFGTYTYSSDKEHAKPALIIDVTAVLSSVEAKNK